MSIVRIVPVDLLQQREIGVQIAALEAADQEAITTTVTAGGGLVEFVMPAGVAAKLTTADELEPPGESGASQQPEAGLSAAPAAEPVAPAEPKPVQGKRKAR